MLSSRYRKECCLLALLLMFCAAANAQQVFGSIFGTVTDPSGSAVVGAKVVVTDINKGTQFEVTTDVSGNYSKGQLVPDQYTVVIESKGFGYQALSRNSGHTAGRRGRRRSVFERCGGRLRAWRLAGLGR